MYLQQILGLFSATAPGCHSNITNLDKAIQVWIGEQCDLQLTDHTMHEDLQLYWLNHIGAGDPGRSYKVLEFLVSGFLTGSYKIDSMIT